MKLNTWGISKHVRHYREFDPAEHRFIETVKQHLGLALVEIKGDGQPVQVGLGGMADPADPDAATEQVTPFFSSYDALDYFCQLNLQRYLACDPDGGLPRRWFWRHPANDVLLTERPLSMLGGSTAEPGIAMSD